MLVILLCVIIIVLIVINIRLKGKRDNEILLTIDNKQKKVLNPGEQIQLGDTVIEVQSEKECDVVVITTKDTGGPIKTVNGDIVITGDIDGNVSSVTGDLQITGSISGTVSTISGNIEVDGECLGSMNTVSGDIYM